jgi:lipopolysaccharide/colanic/teichoic acid biosynthesis glycosyltransferase
MIQLRTQPRSWYENNGARVIDLVLLALTGPAAILLSLPIALGVWGRFRKLEYILYRQPRVGRHGEIFRIIKFRTLDLDHGDCETGVDDQAHTSAFGRFLRRTHLDELPQLWCVFLGQMSFVGPRPESVPIHNWAVDKIDGFDLRLRVRPGITGHAQITQGYASPGEAAYVEKLSRDLEWLESRRLGTDVKILLGTIPWSLRGRGGTAAKSACSRDTEDQVDREQVVSA